MTVILVLVSCSLMCSTADVMNLLIVFGKRTTWESLFRTASLDVREDEKTV
jgi:hypothetical protein